MSERDPKTSFEQVMAAFGGYSPGGCDQPDETGAYRVLYLERAIIEKLPRWKEAIRRLNSAPLIGDIARVEVVDVIPAREVYRMTNGHVVAVNTAISPLARAPEAAA